MRAEPRVRGDGLCALRACRRPRPLVPPRGTRYSNHERLLAADPFCSATCCRKFHGVVISFPERPQSKRARDWHARRRDEREEADAGS
mgnify:CR=1 FL=1